MRDAFELFDLDLLRYEDIRNIRTKYAYSRTPLVSIPQQQQQPPSPPIVPTQPTMADVESAILTALSSGPDATIPDSFAFATSSALDHNSIVGTCKSLYVYFSFFVYLFDIVCISLCVLDDEPYNFCLTYIF